MSWWRSASPSGHLLRMYYLAAMQVSPAPNVARRARRPVEGLAALASPSLPANRSVRAFDAAALIRADGSRPGRTDNAVDHGNHRYAIAHPELSRLPLQATLAEGSSAPARDPLLSHSRMSVGGTILLVVHPAAALFETRS